MGESSIAVYIVLGAYLLINLAVGWLGFKKRSTSPDDYFLAGRGVGTLVLFFTFVATNFSAVFFLGLPGEGYKAGYSFYAMIATGTAFAALSFYFVGFPAWKLGRKFGYVTPAEMVGHRMNSKPLKALFTLFMVGITIPYLAIQPIGAGYLLSELTHGEVPYFLGASLLTVFIVVYVFMGGMRSVAITDMIQGILMFTLMFMALFVVADALGGIEAANNKVFELKPELFSREGGDGRFSEKAWIGWIVLWPLCVPMFPQMFMRFFISKDLGSFKRSTVLYAAVPVLLFLCPIMIGMFGHLEFPGLEGRDTDRILPMMLNKLAPAWLAATIMVGAIAAFMSTMDSQLLAVSTMLTRDFWAEWIEPKVSFKKQVWLGKLFVVLLALVGLAIAYKKPESIFAIVKYAFTGYAVMFPATVAAIYFAQRINGWWCVLSVLAGETIVVLDYAGVLGPEQYGGFSIIVPAVGAAIAPILLGWIFQQFFGRSVG